jgi:hypothetical protein
MFAKSVRFLATVLLHSLLSCALIDGYDLLRHSKLDNDELNQATKRLRSNATAFFSGEFIVELPDNTTDVRATVKAMMVGSGGKISFVYDKLFKGAAISNMSDFSILKLLDKDTVVRASRVGFIGMHVENF